MSIVNFMELYMNEQLLQFIWQFQYFNRSNLFTLQGEALQIIHTGILNKNQGPDFLNARIKIGNTLWVGSVELHLKSSEWNKHCHDQDANYKNVILHVVYENDTADIGISELELKGRIGANLLQRYTQIMKSTTFIPCYNLIQEVPTITITLWKERLLIERLIRKSTTIQAYLTQNNQHWEECFWWLLAKNFGSKINAEAFEAVAQSISINILAKHKHQLIQLEALLLGQAGLLNKEFTDKYALLLQKEYQFLRYKYNLQPIPYSVYFLRMRPSNFPTVRLAQLAALVHQSAHLFSKIIEEPFLPIVRTWFRTTPNNYWTYHYTLTDEEQYKPKAVGEEMINNIVINTIAPMLFAYGHIHQNETVKNKALQWLEATKPEKNYITNTLKKIGFKNNSAWDSQSLIEMKTQYCDAKKCIHCAVGNAIIKP